MSTESPEERDRQHAEAMKALQAKRRELMATKTLERGLLIVLTGSGKGKSSSGFGMVARALGWGMRVAVVQFIKGKWQTGEKRFFRSFPELVTFEVMGEGFSWDVQDRARDVTAAEKAWERSKELIRDPAFEFVLLDEINIAIRNDYLNIEAVVDFLRERPLDKHICLTGRDARPSLIEIADLVTEMTLIKHPFEKGFKAQRGVEF
jgi:cob(I)alamin adenosyltransferase